jgi:hypothetical protein
MTRNQRFLTKMPLYKQDLLNIKENAPIQQLNPYDSNDPWDHSIDTVFQLLRSEMLERNRIKVLMYTYYLGELLNLKALPRIAWLEYVQQHDISDEYHYFLGATRTYQVFKDDHEQIYRTNYLSFWVLARMSKDNFNNNFMQFVHSVREMMKNIRS